MKKKITALLLAVILLLAMPVTALADFQGETRKSVVVVNTCLDLDAGIYSFGWGTGFFVGVPGEDPTYLVTNHHVIDSFLNNGAGELVEVKTTEGSMKGRSKIRVYYDSKDYEEAYPVAYDSAKDVAVLKLAAPTSKRQPLTLCSPVDDMVGSDVYAVGYPGLSENIFADSTTSWGASDASVTSGSFSRLLTTSGTGQVNIQIDCVIRHGNSGGPLVNSDGAALGITTWSVNDGDDAEVYYAVSIDEVIPYLKQYDVPYTMSNEAPAPVDPSAGSSGTNSDVEPQPQPQPQSMPTAAWIGIGAAVVAVAAVVLVLILRKKPQGDASQPPAPAQGGAVPSVPVPAPAPMPAKGTPMVRSLSQQHGGARIPLTGQILIGTSQTECTITFRAGTPGVSRRHCTLAWDAATGDFIVTDLGSSFGTFLENKQKLAQGVPYRLRPGDRFYLGDPANLLSVVME